VQNGAVHEPALTNPGPGRPLRVYLDVSDTARAQWRAGIQRVVVQLLDHLEVADPAVLDVVPVVWLGSAGQHRRLTPAERDALRGESTHASVPVAETAEPAPWRRVLRSIVKGVRFVLRPVRRGVVAAIRAIGLEPPLRRARRAVVLRLFDRELVPLLEEMPRGSVLLEIDSVWNRVEVDRDRLYTRLGARGVHVANLVYDLLPIEHPDWFEDSLVRVFTETMRAEARHSELVMAISRHSADSFTAWARGIGCTPPTPVVVPLGADLAAPTHGATEALDASLPPELGGRRFVLVVGTVEPRKNHAVLIDACEQLWRRGEDVDLVVVGRAGWNNDATLSRLRRHPELGRRLHWYQGIGDHELARLYAAATVVAVPSITEGFGLPVIEGLSAGAPVVSSSGGALPEAGAGLVDTVDPDDTAGWSDAIHRLLHDDEHRRRRRAGAGDYVPPQWSDTAGHVATVLVERFGSPVTVEGTSGA
jgi:glycosyltransferase involved in cell wall biosynthesis